MLHKVACVVVGVFVVGCSSGSSGGGGSTDGGSGTGGSSNGGSGGSSNGGSGGSSSGSCQAACENIASANCPANDSLPDCIADCESDLSTGSCPSEAQSLVACVSTASFTCTTGGNADVSGACAAQVQAFGVCSTCNPDTMDDACDTCSKTSCCTQRKALAGDPQLIPLSQCLTACASDAACIQGCSQQYSSAYAAALAVSQCENGSCPACAG